MRTKISFRFNFFLEEIEIPLSHSGIEIRFDLSANLYYEFAFFLSVPKYAMCLNRCWNET